MDERRTPAETLQERPRNPAPRQAERAARRLRKRRDAAAALTVLGVVIFMSPMVSAFGAAEGASAVPLAVQYIFNFWAILIIGAFLLSRALPRAEEQVAETSDEADAFRVALRQSSGQTDA